MRVVVRAFGMASYTALFVSSTIAAGLIAVLVFELFPRLPLSCPMIMRIATRLFSAAAEVQFRLFAFCGSGNGGGGFPILPLSAMRTGW